MELFPLSFGRMTDYHVTTLERDSSQWLPLYSGMELKSDLHESN
jgi:hypothetical protein